MSSNTSNGVFHLWVGVCCSLQPKHSFFLHLSCTSDGVRRLKRPLGSDVCLVMVVYDGLWMEGCKVMLRAGKIGEDSLKLSFKKFG